MSEKQYDLMLQQLQALLSAESNYLANAANLSSFLYHNVQQVNWLGFYLENQGELVLGPFHGQPACTRIPIGSGVCGTAFAEKTTCMVADVHAFEGHIVCDAASESEIVVPFFTDQINGVLDVDSPVKGRFSEAEKHLFEAAVNIYVDSIAQP